MNKRVDYLFKALVLRMLLKLLLKNECPLSQRYDREARDLIAECEAISDGRISE